MKNQRYSFLMITELTNFASPDSEYAVAGPCGQAPPQPALTGRSLPPSLSLVSVQLVEIIKELSHQIFSLPCLVSALCLHICIGNSIFTFHVTVKDFIKISRLLETLTISATNAGPLKINSRCHLLQTSDNDSVSQHLLAKIE